MPKSAEQKRESHWRRIQSLKDQATQRGDLAVSVVVGAAAIGVNAVNYLRIAQRDDIGNRLNDINARLKTGKTNFTWAYRDFRDAANAIPLNGKADITPFSILSLDTRIKVRDELRDGKKEVHEAENLGATVICSDLRSPETNPDVQLSRLVEQLPSGKNMTVGEALDPINQVIQTVTDCQALTQSKIAGVRAEIDNINKYSGIADWTAAIIIGLTLLPRFIKFLKS